MLERDFALCRFLGHIYRSLRPVKSFEARDLEVGEAVDGIALDRVRISAVCAERIQNRLYQSSGEGKRCVAEGEKLEQRRALLQGLRI